MTSGANRRTSRASTDRAAPPAAPTVGSNELRVLVEALAQLGYDAHRLAAAAGVRARDLDDPDVRLPCASYGAILHEAMAVRPTSNLALRVATKIPIGAYPLLDYLVLTCDTVADGIQQLSRYFRLVGSPLDIEVVDDGDAVEVRLLDGTAAPFTVEYSAALLVLHFRRETDGRFWVSKLCLAHTPDDPREFEAILGCVVEAPTTCNGVIVPREACALTLRRRDPVLRALLEGRAGELIASQPPADDLAGNIRRLLASAAARQSEMRLDEAARTLSMSPRSLQRRLAARGTSYEKVVDDWRKETARRHMEAPGLAIGEIAYLLGYSEPRPFHRAFKRWFGTTPNAFRDGLMDR